MSKDVIDMYVFLCPDCMRINKYWEYARDIREYGHVDSRGNYLPCDYEYSNTYFCCPECNYEQRFEDVLLHVEIDNKNKKVFVETSADHDQLDKDEIKDVVRSYLKKNYDIRDYTIIIDDIDLDDF